MALKRGLGKGLAALLPAENEENSPHDSRKEAARPRLSKEADAASSEDAVSSGQAKKASGEIFIALEKLKANPGQPRKEFDEEELTELANSIMQHGIIDPLIVEDSGDGSYTIIGGERRFRAAQLIGLKEAPVILRKYTDQERMEISLIDNIQRVDLNPIEEASAYKQLMELAGLSQDEVASRVGKNRTTVANALRLLKLPPLMQESLKRNEITAGHARAILSISGTKAQETLFREILKNGLSVREAEKRAAALGNQNKKTANSAVQTRLRAPELGAMEEKFIKRLGTKVVVDGDLNRGTILIDYYSMEDLDRLYEILGG